MYYTHFGLKEHPFKITPNTDFFFTGGNRGAVLDALLYAIKNGEGIIKVVGEVGSGKTMICRMLQTLLTENIETIYLANPSIAPEDILYVIASELQLKFPKNADRIHVMQVLQKYLVDKHSERKQVVVFVEEAQGMPLGTLEEIRLLSNLETTHDKLLQIVLFGQPELDVNLNVPHIRQLKERITHSFNLGPLDMKSVGEYLIFRLRASGYFGPHLFTDNSIKLISKSAEGLVRRINILADKSLLAAFSENAYQVLPKHVKAAIRDCEFGVQQLKVQFRIRLITSIIIIILLSLGMLYGLDQSHKVKLENKPANISSNGSALGNPAKLIQPISPTQSVVAPTNVNVPPKENVKNDVLSKRIIETQAWLKGNPETTVSIQILGATDEEQLRKQLEFLSSQLELDNLYIYRTQVNAKPFFTVLYGSYPNRIEAAQAIARLPNILKSNNPQLRTIGGVLKETNQLQ